MLSMQLFQEVRMAWLTKKQIEHMHFGAVGENVFLSDKASFHNCEKIYIGNRIRIDDFCVLSAGDGGIFIGDYVHVAVFSLLIGKGRIRLNDFCNLSSRVSIYSSNDDYSGQSLTNPMIPIKYKNVISADVDVGEHVIVGSGSIILPGVKLAKGVAVGALSLVKEDVKAFDIVAGVPARVVKHRSKELLILEKNFLYDVSKNEQ